LYNNETPLLVDLADLLYQGGIAFYTVLPTKNNYSKFLYQRNSVFLFEGMPFFWFSFAFLLHKSEYTIFNFTYLFFFFFIFCFIFRYVYKRSVFFYTFFFIYIEG